MVDQTVPSRQIQANINLTFKPSHLQSAAANTDMALLYCTDLILLVMECNSSSVTSSQSFPAYHINTLNTNAQDECKK